jgi:hypothetical protein
MFKSINWIIGSHLSGVRLDIGKEVINYSKLTTLWVVVYAVWGLTLFVLHYGKLFMWYGLDIILEVLHYG